MASAAVVKWEHFITLVVCKRLPLAALAEALKCFFVFLFLFSLNHASLYSLLMVFAFVYIGLYVSHLCLFQECAVPVLLS